MTTRNVPVRLATVVAVTAALGMGGVAHANQAFTPPPPPRI